MHSMSIRHYMYFRFIRYLWYFKHLIVMVFALYVAIKRTTTGIGNLIVVVLYMMYNRL